MYSRALLAMVLAFATLGPVEAVTEPDELLAGDMTMIKRGMFRFDAKGRFDLPDAENAPTVAGATLRVFDTGGAGGDDTYVLPAAGWSQIPAANGKGNKRVRGYRFKGSPGDPCTIVLVKENLVKALCKRGSLTTPFAGDVGIVLSIAGDMKRYCAVFGGTELQNDARHLLRKDAPPPAACPAPGGGTTSTTVAPVPTTTSSTVAPSTTSSTVAAPTTTSSTVAAPTTTSSTVAAPTTTSSTVAAPTTTSSTVVVPTTTSSTAATPTTSTSSTTSSSVATTSTSTSIVTTTTSSTSTTLALCCNGDSFLSFATINAPGDCGDILNQSGALFTNLECAGLYTGGGGNSVPLPLGVPDLGLSVTSITSCVGQTATLGATTSAQTGSNLNCTAPGCFFGAPLAVPNPGTPPTSVCVLNQLSANPMGTANCSTGATSVSMPLSSILYLTGDTATDPGGTITGVQPCPLCTGGDPNTPDSGTCVGGTNDGGSCTPGTTAIDSAYPTSHDCPPDPTFDIGTLPIGLNLTTGTVTWTAVPGTGGSAQLRVFSGFCRDADDTGAFADPPVHCLENGQTLAACVDPFEACEQRNNGAFGPAGGGNRTITAIGSGSSIVGGPGAATLVSIFSIPPTFNATVDAAGDLPGPGAVAIPGTAETCPTANPCP